jgi:hypothetical protein
MNSKCCLKEVKTQFDEFATFQKKCSISKLFEKRFLNQFFSTSIKNSFYENWDLKVKTDRGII